MLEQVKHFRKFCILFLLINFGCNNPDLPADANDQTSFSSKGSYNIDSLEVGTWQFFDSNSQLLEEGGFINGIRRGLWIYYPERDSIIWNELNIKDIFIRTNIPDFLQLFEFDGESAVFKHQDTSKIFTMLIAKGNIPEFVSFQAYNRELYQIFDSKRAAIVDSTSEIVATSAGRSFLYNYIIAQFPDSTKFINT